MGDHPLTILIFQRMSTRRNPGRKAEMICPHGETIDSDGGYCPKRAQPTPHQPHTCAEREWLVVRVAELEGRLAAYDTTLTNPISPLAIPASPWIAGNCPQGEAWK